MNNPRVGQLVKVVANTSSHSHTIGTKAKITHINKGNMTIRLEGNTTYLYHADVEPANLSLTDLESRRTELLRELAAIDESVSTLRELGETELDGDVVRCLGVLKTLNGSASDLEKAKEIVELLQR